MIARQTTFTAPYLPADDGAATSQHLLGMLYGLHLTLHMPMFTHGTRRGLSSRPLSAPTRHTDAASTSAAPREQRNNAPRVDSPAASVTRGLE